MNLPTPDDPGRAPVWENYVVAQAVQASLGLLPPSALAVGVKVAGVDVQMCFQATDLNDDSSADIDEIISELQHLVGDHVYVGKQFALRENPETSPHDNVRWIFLARR